MYNVVSVSGIFEEPYRDHGAFRGIAWSHKLNRVNLIHFHNLGRVHFNIDLNYMRQRVIDPKNRTEPQWFLSLTNARKQKASPEIHRQPSRVHAVTQAAPGT